MYRKVLEVTIFSVLLVVLIGTGLASAADVAYVLKDNTPVSSVLSNKLNQMELSYDIIRESQIRSTNFFNYQIVLVSENVNNAGFIPLQEVNSIFLDRRIATTVWDVRGLPQSGFMGGSNLNVDVVIPDSFVFDSVDINGNEEVRIYSGAGEIHYINPPIRSAITTVAIKDGGGFRPSISYSMKETQRQVVKSFFFGAPSYERWSSDGKQIFENALFWLRSDVDQDNDGWSYSEDCDDHNPLVNPGMTEIPYDGIDNDCRDGDLRDVDNDGYDAEIVGGEDCDDENPLINPENPDPILNCIDDVPIFTGLIPNFEIVEDMPLENALNLNNYFFDHDSNLDFHVFGNVNINIVIDNEGSVSFYPGRDFNGIETIYFVASDESSSVNSNIITLTVLEAGEPPVFSELNCETNILEDIRYTCELNASDFEGNEFTFSVVREQNLKCNIVGNVLTYSSVQDYNGEGSCDLKVSDIHGSDFKTLRVSVAPVNDAPRILSSAPTAKTLRFVENTNNAFSVQVVDVDSVFSTSWFLNGVLKKMESTANSRFSFTGSNGIYLVEVLVSDSEFTASESWSVIFGSVEEFSCSEINGKICKKTEICASDVLQTRDSGVCCTSSCIPEFKDANACKILNENLVVDIKKIGEDSAKPKLGEKFKVEFEIVNNYGENQDIEAEVYLYNLNADESVSETSTDFEVLSGRRRIARIDLEIPDELDLDDKYAVFVKAEGDICNQKFKDLEIERQKSKVIISDLKIPAGALCGETVNGEIETRNIGSEEQDVVLEVKSSDLELDKRFEFLLEKSGEDDENKEKIMFAIPYDTEAGEYEISVRAVYDSKSESLTQSLKVACKKSEISEEIFSPEESTIILSQRNIVENLKNFSSENKPNYALITLVLMFNFVLAASGGLLYLAWAKRNS